jgi:hypothetical protein
MNRVLLNVQALDYLRLGQEPEEILLLVHKYDAILSAE